MSKDSNFFVLRTRKNQRSIFASSILLILILTIVGIILKNMFSHFSRLVDRVENMKKNAMGNGSTQCVLCADEFGLLGASPTYCDDCRKVSFWS